MFSSLIKSSFGQATSKVEVERVAEKSINFYDPMQTYGEFSNAFHSPFKEGDNIYCSNQHYFQSKKFKGTPKEDYVASAPNAYEAMRRGNQRKEPLRPDWEDVKEKVMKEGLKLKFRQNPHLLERLMSTGNRIIYQHTEYNDYWGDGGGLGRGKNRLGVLLMEVREEFRRLK